MSVSPPRRPADEITRLHAAFALSREPRLRAELVTHYDNLAVSLAHRVSARRESREDLVQVARIGLLHAVDRFNPDRERPFVVFARATILGELKHHARDRTWGMRVSRGLQQDYLDVVRSVDELTQELGRLPRIPEIAARAGLTDQQVVTAIHVDSAGRIDSFDRPNDDGIHLDPCEEDPNLERVEERSYLATLAANLPERTKRMLELRFRDELTQLEIARRVGRSQMCVSRTIIRTLEQMRVVAHRQDPLPEAAYAGSVRSSL